MPRRNPWLSGGGQTLFETKREALRHAKELRHDGAKVVVKKDRFTGGWLTIRRNPSRRVKHKTLTLAALSKGVRGLVKIRKVRNGIRVTVKR